MHPSAGRRRRLVSDTNMTDLRRSAARWDERTNRGRAQLDHSGSPRPRCIDGRLRRMSERPSQRSRAWGASSRGNVGRGTPKTPPPRTARHEPHRGGPPPSTSSMTSVSSAPAASVAAKATPVTAACIASRAPSSTNREGGAHVARSATTMAAYLSNPGRMRRSPLQFKAPYATERVCLRGRSIGGIDASTSTMAHRAQHEDRERSTPPGAAPRTLSLWLALFGLACLVAALGGPRPGPTRSAERTAAAADQSQREHGLEPAPSQLEASGVIDSDSGSEEPSDDSSAVDDSWQRALLLRAGGEVSPCASEPCTPSAATPAWASAIGRGPRKTRGPPRG